MHSTDLVRSCLTTPGPLRSPRNVAQRVIQEPRAGRRVVARRRLDLGADKVYCWPRKKIDHTSPLHPMSRLVCIVCGLSNRESSKRCSRCLSPLGLRLCYRCESINTLSATQCSQCGASLSSALEEVPIYPAASTEASQRAENAFATVGSVPAALAERFGGRCVRSERLSARPACACRRASSVRGRSSVS